MNDIFICLKTKPDAIKPRHPITINSTIASVKPRTKKTMDKTTDTVKTIFPNIRIKPL
ncbi:hypothetical protein AS4_17790 [Acinetobacter guillouiae]|nr:hypothetical protein AS4_17790 [Acinetobacter guillouiae]